MRYLFLLLTIPAWASGIKTMNPVGDHYPILTVEKNENPQNIMMIYTKLSKDCKVERDEDEKDKPVFAFYWLMDHKNYKRVHPLIQSGIRDRLQVGKVEADGFNVVMADLKELETDISDPTLHVKVFKDSKGDCQVDATMKLGPSDKNRVIHLETIYSDAKKTMWHPPTFRRLISVRLDGKDIADGSAVHRTYQAK